jgi:cytosine/adenosine deaminase-related metal-dependent hydrolase
MLPVEGPPIAGGAVCVDDGWIVDAGVLADVRGRHVEAPVVDLGEAILAPGFVDAHAHLEWSLMDGVLPSQPFGAWLGRLMGLRGRMEPEDHLVAARHAAVRALRAGTTTLADSGPTGAGVIAMAETGLRGPVHLEAFGREEGEEARARAGGVAERVAALAAAADARNRVGLSPHAPYTVGPGLWAALAGLPSLAGLPWATHLAESEDETRVIAGGDGALADVFSSIGAVPGRWPGAEGARPVERLAGAGALREGLVAAHCVQLGEDDPSLLADAGVGVAHCPRSNEYLHCGRAPLQALREAGVPLGLGTDSPASGGDYDVRAEARACGRIHGDDAGSPEALIRLATIGGARVLGLDAEVGSLVPGKRADLVALHTAPGAPRDPWAAALAAGTEVTTVVIDGAVALADDRPTGIDAGEVETAATRARRRLW